MSLVMSPDLGYFPPEADEKSRARFCAGRFAAESRARVAGRALAARPAVPARTPAVAPRPARDRRACAKHLRLSCATTAGIQRASREPRRRQRRALDRCPV